jgi:hypothetical protein
MKTTYFDHAYPYEGMANYESPAVVVSGNVAAESPSTSYFGWMGSLFPSIPSVNTVSKVEGFALHPSPLNEPDLIDRFAKTPGDKSCFGKSAGLSRDAGPLCLSEEDLKLLGTRGGNSTGRDSVIGHP